MELGREGDGGALSSGWVGQAPHRAWLMNEAVKLLRFFEGSVSEDGTFNELDEQGLPMPTGCPPALRPQENLLTVARMVHSYGLGELLGVPGCSGIVDTGLRTLWERYRDLERGGYVEAISKSGIVDATRSAYGHAFVLLGASTALMAGHSDARVVLEDVLRVIDRYFWSESDGCSAEAFDGDWEEVEEYRGANSNMHLFEAFLAAADATGREELAQRGDRIAWRLINIEARGNRWLLPEHYDRYWQKRLDYNRSKRDDPFRPYGATVGHLLEWSRLLVSAAAGGEASEREWFVPAAEALFARAVEVGWDGVNGGLVYTVDWDGRVANADRYWWAVAEGIGASIYLWRATGEREYVEWYRRFWDYAALVLIDHERGGWYPLFDERNRRKVDPWYGKPDIYHSLQACVLPLYKNARSVASAIAAGS